MDNDEKIFWERTGEIRVCRLLIEMIEEGWISSFDELKAKIEWWKNDVTEEITRKDIGFPELCEKYNYMIR